jgi:short-subunit dehydrogenase/MoaA/NifB/PqqE/SkfB family radical SAM enzyme
MPGYDFENKQILVTGATGGLGSAMVRRLADMGARLVVTSRSSPALDELMEFLPDRTLTIPLVADLSKPGAPHALAEQALNAAGHIDVLFNIAGVGYFSLIEEATEENLRYLYEVNTFAPMLLIKALLPHMTARNSGRIVNIASSAGRVPIPSVGVYGGSKSALAIMSNTLRLELRETAVAIVNIYPGTVDTAFEENALREKFRAGLCPVDRCGKPRFEVADRILSAAKGPPGEIWLESQGLRMAVAALKKPHKVDRRLSALSQRVAHGAGPKDRPWRLLQVETALACNLQCVMCPWQQKAQYGGPDAVMPPEVWQALRLHLPSVASVDFTGGGEPLLQPHLVSWVADAHAAGCETGILTNGLLMDGDQSKALIDAGIDWVCVSIDAATEELYRKIRRGSDFDTVCRNVRTLSRLRRGKRPKLMINFVLMTLNVHQTGDMVDLASRLGVDQLNFKQCDVIRGKHGRDLGLFDAKGDKAVRQLEKDLQKVRKQAEKLNLQTTAFAFRPKELPVCAQDPRNSMFIRHDGRAAPCINLAMGGPTTFLGRQVTMPNVRYGRLPQQDLADIWESGPCRFYRDLFEARSDAHEKVYIDGMLRATSNLDRLEQQAVAAMPKAPAGCRICHYLYDI